MLTRLSVQTLVQTSSLLDAPLEDRAHVRDGQDLRLLAPEILDPAASGGVPLAAEHRHSFYYGCVDLMPYLHQGRTAYQVLELNGTGMGGLTNLPEPVQAAILGELGRAAEALPDHGPAPWVLCPLSRPSTKGLIHERILVGQALAEGLARRFGPTRLALRSRLREDDPSTPGAPTVVLGFPDEMRDGLAAQAGRLTLLGRPVSGVMRDLFCHHITDELGGALQPGGFHAINEIYRICASKVETYARYNAFLAAQPCDLPGGPVGFHVALNRDELVHCVCDQLGCGRSVVIKPHASGAAKGIEFFLAPRFPGDRIDQLEVAAKVDAAIAEARERFTRALTPDQPRQVFPYAICGLLDGLTVRDPAHRLAGHRHELRIVVYRHHDRIRAFPALCKVSGLRLDHASPDRRALLNTASLSASATGGPHNEHLLPLCNAGTLAALGIEPATLAALCEFAARFVAFVIAGHSAQPQDG